MTQMPAELVTRTFDVAVIGGGAAGLSAALVLGRARRSVIVIDAGSPRNAPAAGVHGFLSRDGISPADLTQVGRKEVDHYGGRLVNGTARAAQRTADGFEVTLDDAGPVTARRLLVTTGLVDDLPDVPGVRDRWGRDVLHCPYCHGWEIRDQPVGILGTGDRAVHQALLFRQWTSDLVLFTHTAPALTDEQAERLAARDIRVVTGTVASLEVTDDRLTGVRLADGTVIARNAVVVSPRFRAAAQVLASLGLSTSDHPSGFGEFVPADPTGLTAVPGVWVAGNVTDLAAQVVVAAAAGATAAAAINADLVDEDTRRAVDDYRHRRLEPARSAPATTTGQPAHQHAGTAGHQHAGTAGHQHTGTAGHQHTGTAGHQHTGTAGHQHTGAHGHQPAGDPAVLFTQEFWDDRYRSAERIWSGEPNPHLVATVADLPPASALDVGCGEGADAIWLAGRGWRVTGIDVSGVALGRAAARAAEAGPEVADRLTWQRTDVLAWDPGQQRFDLVSAQFMHLPRPALEALHRRLAAAVRPGGTLLIVGHHPSDLDTSMGRPQLRDLMFTAQELAAKLDPDDWEIVSAAAPPRQAPDPQGRSITIRDAVLRAVRRR